MILTDDETTLSPDDDGIVDEIDEPVQYGADPLELLPAFMRRGIAPIRDAIVAGAAAVGSLLRRRLGRAIMAVSSPRYADDDELEVWGEIHKRPRVAEETASEYRQRLLISPKGITPTNIRAAVHRLAETFGVIDPVILEPAIDQMFVAPLDSDWWCFIQPTDPLVRLWGEDPKRVGQAWGAHVAPDVEKPLFWILTPDGAGDTEPRLYSMPLDADEDAQGDSYVQPYPDETCFVFEKPVSLSDKIIPTVEQLRAAGVVWELFTDRGLFQAR